MPRYICTSDGSNKFWEADVTGSTLTVTFGKIGTAGQRKDKKLESPDAARAELEKLTSEKLKKGYVADGGKAKAGAKAAKPAKANATSAKPAKAKPHPFLFYGVAPLQWAEGANCGHVYVLCFESAPPASARSKLEKAFVRAAGDSMDTQCGPWQWKGAWALMCVGEKRPFDDDDYFDYYEFFAEIGKALLAVHAVAALREVINLNAQTKSRSPSPWETWTLKTQPKPSPWPDFGHVALFFES